MTPTFTHFRIAQALERRELIDEPTPKRGDRNESRTYFTAENGRQGALESFRNDDGDEQLMYVIGLGESDEPETGHCNIYEALPVLEDLCGDFIEDEV
ncbi:hypothetical protein C3B44_03290 [Corynebacterium yudongzhengii]|uniref:Uncharacterized protein n=1 Tax=Corynebacterium yudongzhengii TaxID=2080740 RepID=A0A2U1T7G4_9CORY|nr:hypothetical protein [Corynebacterium yudongzhengii]AWB81497.1 hypothetical protein C3B44_03290 [Corynebacterium yudongzhengii]PWC01932.1 hypothetical protein DF222_04955 [Corynebacterium yudongzhengii]